MKFRELHADEIEVKVKQVTSTGFIALLYKTARTDMDLLDETVGPENWQCAHEEIKGNLYCKIGIWSDKHQQWIWKQDCGIESREDGEGNEKKGEASDSFKRAGFKWGIGRELYTSPFIWISKDVVPVEPIGNNKYKIADKFAKFHVKKIGYTDGTITMLEIADNKHRVVYTFGSDTPIKTQKPTTEEPKRKLSPAAQKEIDSAMSLDSLKHIYNMYATTEPITELREACGLKRKLLEEMA
jgi:hypothetical protein